MANKDVKEKLTEGRQYRAVMEVRALPGEDEARIVEGYATTFNQPYELWRDGPDYIFLEQVDRGAFDKTDMSDVIMQYDHEGRVFARTNNGTLTLAADDHGLHIRADLSGTEIGRQLYEEIKGGYTDKMSFGFTVDSDERLITEEAGVVTILRTIKSIGKLYDVSAVSLPANNATEISARSWCDGVIAQLTEERREAEARERKKQKIKIMLNL
jgi:phage prohead protease, HK97 family